MLDIFNLPNLEKNTFVFNNCGSTCWQIWQKPRNCKIVNFFLASGAGGGGGGQTGTGTNRFGGGGGGGSSIQKGVFQAAMIPDTLYVLVGGGGLGGAPNGNGATGSLSYVSVGPVVTSASVLLRSGATAPTAGTPAGATGGAGSVFNQATGLISYLGITSQITGINGSAGGSNAGGAGGSQTKSGIFTGGAGGGGASSAGVQGSGGTVVSTTTIITSSIGGLAGATNDGGAGYFGLIPSIDASTKTPFTFVGGGGGGANATGIGGNGGNGAIGCGGGGGGAGTTGGRGGNGGDGIVIITCF
jgi:hypothetical protein